MQRWADKLDGRVTSIAGEADEAEVGVVFGYRASDFDTALLELREELQDYVIVHELLHTRVPNHGKLWKGLLIAYLGDCEALETESMSRVRNSVPTH